MKYNSKWHQVCLLFFSYHIDARSNKHKISIRLKRDRKQNVCIRNDLTVAKQTSISSVPFLKVWVWKYDRAWLGNSGKFKPPSLSLQLWTWGLLLVCTLCCCVSLGSSSLSHYVSTKLIAQVCGIHLSYYGDSVKNILSFIHVCVWR